MGLFDHLFPDSYDDSVEGEDYYLTKEGYRVMTESYLVKRGYCCANGCRHCPYDPKAQKGNRKLRHDVAKRYNK
ncbi:DUF5522 domain-containing protein [Sunxiuqinia elliptica]|uniref:Uncharacterized protein n=1 Tax=Sunxiuqinia elliptica TaxID=655355 RepID=A0A1I2JQD3_9BACT|nr:DUF5522 domain-containing protein [Sunxiuqinia elliptica]TDO03185.1 hypothetical protein DET52_103126 [Sunxiuqinia elliptica]TDO59382.1 hypothetical protein DET65_2669 [Sunxiuqinia elliptica]SFF55357.1 hypothetical protein SAMN05216283_10939 [Sunxiuqinia elliptica]